MDSVEAHGLLCCWSGKGYFIFHDTVYIPTMKNGQISDRQIGPN